MDKNVAIVRLQGATANMLQLGSSDEITISRVKVGEPDALQNQSVEYRATTARGRVLDCNASLMAGTILSEPSVTSPKCVPVNVHK
ncbi:hypothetical protein MMG00_02205 [Ignatzschineria rhizosphaerae]|uniref:DUF5666 domain-containing protein n=1 Tax=Ignatzschineria rhizosphaerae TaxID=2923279 RepID=A0ABY3X6N9_9GAMM|nr:hypothetical protein [Ignatzschineria rhizosphaerae]UNM96697.1 hypothetical protein MMG00_02205 [Ignatzschineria rhizosphaerae]